MMQLSSKVSFERLCMGRSTGFACDDRNMIKPLNPNNYDEVVFKIITKCDSSLLLLESSSNSLVKFSIDLVSLDPHQEHSDDDDSVPKKWSFNFFSSPNNNKAPKKLKTNVDMVDIIESAWTDLEQGGSHGMSVIGLLGPDSMPNNECRTKYTLGQFVNHVIHSVEAHYMFHKPNLIFVPGSFGSEPSIREDSRTYDKGFAVILTWSYKKAPSGKIIKLFIKQLTIVFQFYIIWEKYSLRCTPLQIIIT